MSNERPMTDAEMLSANILLLIADARIEDAQLALDVVGAFVQTLGLEPGQRLSDCKSQDEQACTLRSLH